MNDGAAPAEATTASISAAVTRGISPGTVSNPPFRSAVRTLAMPMTAPV